MKGHVILLALMLFLAACGGVGQPATEPPPLTLEPIPTPFIAGNCEITTDLETWLQTLTFRQREFTGLVEAAQSKRRQEVYADAERMAEIVNIISELGTPDCAIPTQEAVLAPMQTTLATFQQYVNNERDDIDAIVTQAQADLEGGTNAIAALINRLEDQYAAQDKQDE